MIFFNLKLETGNFFQLSIVNLKSQCSKSIFKVFYKRQAPCGNLKNLEPIIVNYIIRLYFVIFRIGTSKNCSTRVKINMFANKTQKNS